MSETQHPNRPRRVAVLAEMAARPDAGVFRRPVVAEPAGTPR